MGERPAPPPFDTQRAVEELVAAGMPPEQAGVIVRLHLRWVDRDLATGKDIDRLRAETDRLRENMEVRFEAVEQRIDARFAALEAKIAQSATATIKWAATSQIGTAAVYLAALLAAIKF